MIRKFNYTGRKKLSKQRVEIIIIEERPHKSFSAKIDLKGLVVADAAKIYIEPYYRSSFMRFDFGTVSEPKMPISTALTDIPSSSAIRFRVKIVDETQAHGRILYFADKIEAAGPNKEDNRFSLLHIDWDKELDQQIFRLTFPENDFPRLELNKLIGNAKELVASDAIFRALVFPVAVRLVAEKIARDWNEIDKEDRSWQSMWLKFIREILHVSTVPVIEEEGDNEDEITFWVEEVVEAFCRKNKVRTKFEQSSN